MKRIEIKRRWHPYDVLFSTDVEDDDPRPIVTAILAAKASGSNLRGSDLRGSNLRCSDLSGSDLSGSDLRGSNLRGSDLSGSDLRGSDLRGSDLRGSDLSGSNLSDSNLSDSDLSGSNLRGIVDDFRARLDLVPREVAGLLSALRDGRVDGSCYEGECACFIGTVANVRGCNYQSLGDLKPDIASPTEKWFLAIRRGHTPDTSQIAAITEGWILEWQAARGEGELVQAETIA